MTKERAAELTLGVWRRLRCIAEMPEHYMDSKSDSLAVVKHSCVFFLYTSGSCTIEEYEAACEASDCFLCAYFEEHTVSTKDWICSECPLVSCNTGLYTKIYNAWQKQTAYQTKEYLEQLLNYIDELISKVGAWK